MEKLIKYLSKAEGTKVHHLSGEKDITSPYGIYKHVHPNDKMFKYIDEVANKHGVKSDSKYWTKDEIDIINEHIDFETVKSYASNFYRKYLNNTPYELLPDECKLSFFSMYTNSRTKAIKAVQQSIIDMSKTGSMSFERMSTVDGIPGANTNNCVKAIAEQGNVYLNYYLETLMISNMKDEYIELALANPDKYLEYLNGWKNRMDILQQI